jgi:hypothetical protein
MLPLVISAPGCRKATGVSGPVTADAAPKIIESAFQSADGSVKTEAVVAATATSNQDPAALAALARVMQRPDLTSEQRAALGRCLPAAMSATQAAADRGDAKAAAALKVYRANK